MKRQELENAKEEEKIAELKKKRREMKEELDELKGNTKEGKALCVIVFFSILWFVGRHFCGNGKA